MYSTYHSSNSISTKQLKVKKTMATLLILIFLLLTIFLLLLKRIRASIITLIFTVVCFLGIGVGIIPSILLNQLQKPYAALPTLPKWGNRNAIVLLGAGTIKTPITHQLQPTVMAYSRISKAAHLYLVCLKAQNNCTILISGGDAQKNGKPESVVYRDVLLGLGIKKTAMKLESKSMNTYKNAEYTSGILNKNNYDQVILVTSGIHLKRALLYFSNFGINAKPALADYLAPQLSFIPLGYNFAITDFAIHEYMGIVKFYIYNFFGWSKESSSAGAL